MDKVSVTARILFQEPFWFILFERVEDRKLSVCKVVVGEEPKDYEIYDFILRNYCKLRFSPAVATDVKEKKCNPKRMQREVQKQLQKDTIGTKSQIALKLQQEQMKQERKVRKREKNEEKKQLQFELKRQKKKEKHRGR
ncbi:MAG: YjdF family protein [Lachnospiraceae bacterium]|nr:YjdF family protein [Lachnospiraceae bacterium]